MNNKQRRKLAEDEEWDARTKFDLMPPVSLEDVRPCDVKYCSRCNVQVYVGDLELEKRSPGLFSGDIEGIYCPNCDQLMFDRESWLAHEQEQQEWDVKYAEQVAKEDARSERKDPRRAAPASAEKARKSAEVGAGW